MVKRFTTLALAASFALASTSALAQDLRVLSWEGYADNDWVEQFEAEYGVDVSITYATSDEEIWAKIKGSEGQDFDLFAISSAELPRYVDAGLVVPHDVSALPNRKKGSERFADLSAVSGMTKDGDVYGIPYIYDSIGVVYNKDIVNPAPTSWEAFWDPAYAGQTLLYDSSHQGFSVCGLMMGVDDPFNMSDAELEECVGKLVEMKRNGLSFFTSPDEAVQLYNSNDVALIWATFGQQQYTALLNAGANVGYVNPSEGALTWLDSWAITSGAADKKLAEAFVNFLLSPEIGQQIIDRTGFGVASVDAEGGNPDDKLIWLRVVEDPTKRQDLWNKVKATP